MIYMMNGQFIANAHITSPSNRIREKINKSNNNNQPLSSRKPSSSSSAARMDFAIKSAHGSRNGIGIGGGGLIQSVYNEFQNSDGGGIKSFGISSKKVTGNSRKNDFHGDRKIDQKTLNKIKEIINAAVKTRFSMETKEADFDEDDYDQTPQVIEIGGSELPLEIHFKSSSSRINIKQSHETDEGQTIGPMKTNSKPMRIIHENYKPVIAEIREIITPYRKVFQEIQPVMEEIHTVVTQGKKRKKIKPGHRINDGGGTKGGSGSSSNAGGGLKGGSGGRQKQQRPSSSSLEENIRQVLERMNERSIQKEQFEQQTVEDNLEQQQQQQQLEQNDEFEQQQQVENDRFSESPESQQQQQQQQQQVEIDDNDDEDSIYKVRQQSSSRNNAVGSRKGYDRRKKRLV
nr:RNA polymerase II degradation factor 1-like [Dermatophagoides farinae]